MTRPGSPRQPGIWRCGHTAPCSHRQRLPTRSSRAGAPASQRLHRCGGGASARSSAPDLHGHREVVGKLGREEQLRALLQARLPRLAQLDDVQLGHHGAARAQRLLREADHGRRLAAQLQAGERGGVRLQRLAARLLHAVQLHEALDQLRALGRAGRNADQHAPAAGEVSCTAGSKGSAASGKGSAMAAAATSNAARAYVSTADMPPLRCCPLLAAAPSPGHPPLLGGVHAVADDLRLLQVGRAVKHLDRVGRALWVAATVGSTRAQHQRPAACGSRQRSPAAAAQHALPAAALPRKQQHGRRPVQQPSPKSRCRRRGRQLAITSRGGRPHLHVPVVHAGGGDQAQLGVGHPLPEHHRLRKLHALQLGLGVQVKDLGGAGKWQQRWVEAAAQPAGSAEAPHESRLRRVATSSEAPPAAAARVDRRARGPRSSYTHARSAPAGCRPPRPAPPP